MVDYYANYTSTQALRAGSEAQETTRACNHFRYSILPHLPSDRNAFVLDVACGYGRYLKALQECGYSNCFGSDLSGEQVAFAQNKLRLANVRQGDGVATLQQYAAQCDVVLMLDILEHLTTDQNVDWLTNGYAALKPSGVLIIQVPNSLSPFSPNFNGDITHQRAYSPASLAQLMSLAGIRRFTTYPAFEAPFNFRSTVRLYLWKWLLNPSLWAFMKIAYGNTLGGIHTANLLTFVRKPGE
jgi:2-polyprenyl-3-methyl-5-hydroxy-6-metoxy-1,4-benzoquinol methylase